MDKMIIGWFLFFALTALSVAVGFLLGYGMARWRNRKKE